MLPEPFKRQSGGAATASERKARLLARGRRLDLVLTDATAISALARAEASGLSARQAIEQALKAHLP